MTNEELTVRIKAGIDTADNMLALWEQNKRFIHGVAKKYTSYAELDDLEQEGYLALYDAVDGYDPERGVKFLTYASYWIEQRIRRYVQNNSTVHIPASEQAKVYEYKKMFNAFQVYLGRKPTGDEIAYNMGLSYKEVAELEKTVRMGQIASLDSPIPDSEGMTLADAIPDGRDDAGELLDTIQQEQLESVIWGTVDELQGDQPEIIRKRYQGTMTLQQVGDSLGISRSRVRSEEAKGIRALREPRYSERLRPFYTDTIYNNALHGCGVSRFSQTWTSSTERVAMEL